jgi:hypothetical protein
MLCPQLILLCSSDARGVRGAHVNSFTQQALLRGSLAREPAFKADLHAWELDAIHTGKDASISHNLAGGNGFAECHYQTHMATAAFAAGQAIERRDLRSLLFWQKSLANCQLDMHRRFQV